MEYRKAALSDIDVLMRLRMDMIAENGPLPEPVRERIAGSARTYFHTGIGDGSFCMWLAEQTGEAAGMGGAAVFLLPPNDWCPGGKTAYIGCMYTAPVFRRQGVASRLLEFLLAELKEQGCGHIMLHATDMGRPLYEKFGFEVSPSSMALYPFGTYRL